MRRCLSLFCPRARSDRCGSWQVVGILVLMLLSGLASGGVWARSGEGDPPVYNPASKSYFQVVRSHGGKWGKSRAQARSLIYKGARGRLAVIDSQETHEFIIRNFDMSRPVWIGLRYWCEFQLLEWAGFRPYSPSDPGHFQIWHPQWALSDPYCPINASGPDAYLGVYYHPTGNNTARWRAAKEGKGFSFILVEYPTGGE